jgi:hypothetical protein
MSPWGLNDWSFPYIVFPGGEGPPLKQAVHFPGSACGEVSSPACLGGCVETPQRLCEDLGPPCGSRGPRLATSRWSSAPSSPLLWPLHTASPRPGLVRLPHPHLSRLWIPEPSREGGRTGIPVLTHSPDSHSICSPTLGLPLLLSHCSCFSFRPLGAQQHLDEGPTRGGRYGRPYPAQPYLEGCKLGGRKEASLR